MNSFLTFAILALAIVAVSSQQGLRRRQLQAGVNQGQQAAAESAQSLQASDRNLDAQQARLNREERQQAVSNAANFGEKLTALIFEMSLIFKYFYI